MAFVPKGQEGLLLRSPFMYGFVPPSSSLQPKSIYSKDYEKTHVLGKKDRQILMRNPEKLAFYTRHNPHPTRVCHMKGLLDAPICCVQDDIGPRYLLSPPSGQDFGPGYRPKGSTRYAANVDKGIPAIGVVPVTSAWRDELEKKTQNAILRAMGQPLPSRESMGSQMGFRRENQFDHLQDEKLLDILCRILQTDSIPACLAWLSSASESEKTIVLNMIKMAACGELPDSFHSRPRTSESREYCYVWAPNKSHTHTKKSHYSNQNNNTEFNFPYQSQEQEQTIGGLQEADDDLPFKLPANDTIVRTARQLSRLASRNGSRSAREVGDLYQVEAHDINKKIAEKLKDPVNDKVIRRRRSASLNMPTSTHHHNTKGESTSLKKTRSRSMHAKLPAAAEANYPPAPVKVAVTKESIHGTGERGSSRLRYVSHWES